MPPKTDHHREKPPSLSHKLQSIQQQAETRLSDKNLSLRVAALSYAISKQGVVSVGGMSFRKSDRDAVISVLEQALTLLQEQQANDMQPVSKH